MSLTKTLLATKRAISVFDGVLLDGRFETQGQLTKIIARHDLIVV